MIALMKRILNVAGGYKGRIQLAFVFSFLKSLLAKAPIGMAFLVLTAFLDGSAGSRLCLTMGAAMAICLVLQVLCQHAADRLQSAAGFMVFAEKRMELGAHLRKLPMGYFTEGNIGKISSVLSTDMVFIEENCMTALADMMSYIFAEAIMLFVFDLFGPMKALYGQSTRLTVMSSCMDRIEEVLPRRSCRTRGRPISPPGTTVPRWSFGMSASSMARRKRYMTSASAWRKIRWRHW